MTTCPKCVIFACMILLFIILMTIPASFFTYDGCFIGYAYVIFGGAFYIVELYTLWRIYAAIRDKSIQMFIRPMRLLKGLAVAAIIQTILSISSQVTCRESDVGSSVTLNIIALVLQEFSLYYFYYTARRIRQFLNYRPFSVSYTHLTLPTIYSV
eukprot:TRINITY_DN19902_c0_g1_i1.p1 TRINITY_DN19902_c0_g1~~TRINITY_DN19902_c0_g1_i1.p1  ORF type:complete len:155 (+),score=19.29 TRINITY_DN19902_c0_g1_i1:124-588(+)